MKLPRDLVMRWISYSGCDPHPQISLGKSWVSTRTDAWGCGGMTSRRIVGSRAAGEKPWPSRRLPDRVGWERLDSGRNDIVASLSRTREKYQERGSGALVVRLARLLAFPA